MPTAQAPRTWTGTRLAAPLALGAEAVGPVRIEAVAGEGVVAAPPLNAATGDAHAAHTNSAASVEAILSSTRRRIERGDCGGVCTEGSGSWHILAWSAFIAITVLLNLFVLQDRRAVPAPMALHGRDVRSRQPLE